MFCSECGKSAQGKFCSHCGTRIELASLQLAVDPRGAANIDLVAVELVPESADTSAWEQEIRYEAILKFPAVRSAIERQARLAPKRMTGEQFLALAEKVVSTGVPMEGLAAAAQAIFTRLGIKTGKQQAQQVPAPVGRVLVRALCSLARNGQSLRSVTQAPDACLLEAELPSDVFSLAGDLLVGVRRAPIGAEVTAIARIGGQLYDWGKSGRSLDQLFGDLTRDAA